MIFGVSCDSILTTSSEAMLEITHRCFYVGIKSSIINKLLTKASTVVQRRITSEQVELL